MTDLRIWLIGLIPILLWFALGLSFDMWADKIGVDPGIMGRLLYLLPALSGFWVAYCTVSNSLVLAILLIFPVVTLGPLTNFAFGKLGLGSDFPGVSGIGVTFWIFLVTALITIIPGAVAGLLMKRVW